MKTIRLVVSDMAAVDVVEQADCTKLTPEFHLPNVGERPLHPPFCGSPKIPEPERLVFSTHQNYAISGE